MRRFMALFLAVLAVLVAPARAQIGKRVSIHANTPEDKALAEINAETDPANKLKLIDKFLADYGKGDMAVVAYELYIAHYQARKNPDRVYEYGEKLLSVDPENLPAGVNMVRAAQDMGDTNKLFTAGERVAGILSQYKAKKAPQGADATTWEQEKAKSLAEAKENINYVQYTLFNTAYQTRDPAMKSALLERFATAFPDSPYTASAQALTAASYQQAQNYPKMLAFANNVLSHDPNNVSMLLLLSEYYSDSGQQLDKAETYAKKALELLPAQRKPEGVSDDQWQKQLSLQKGLALSALGQVYITRRRDAQALESFRAAAPLLKGDNFSYARNQYRMGFALLNLKRMAEARSALNEAASVDSPYRALAQDKLKGLPPSPVRKRP